MCRLALTVGEVSLTSMLQVILLLSGSYVAHLDMPSLWRSLMPTFLGQLRVYLCPSDVAGISNEN